MRRNRIFIIVVITMLFSCKSNKLSQDSREIDWSNQQLQNISFKDLLKFQKLEKIDLSDNNLITFPDSLYLLPNLKILLLSRNKITILPEEINKFRFLRTLDLSGNEIVVFPDMKDMSNLEVLSIEAQSADFLQKLSCSVPKRTKIVYNLELKPYTSEDCDRSR